MNESAPATLRVPVPWWERLAAGVVAATWAGWVFWARGAENWWNELKEGLVGVVAIWQGVIQTGGFQWLPSFGGSRWIYPFMHGLIVSFYFSLVLIVVAGGAMAAGIGFRRVRRVFWVAMLGHALLGLGVFSLAGRLAKLFYEGQLSPWHGGWLSFLLDEGYNPFLFGACVCLGTLLASGCMLWLSRSRMAVDTAEGRAA